jgi:GT2 family glycosyltransferase
VGGGDRPGEAPTEADLAELAGVDPQARADDALDRFLRSDEAAVVRRHRVQALVLAHEGGPWLPRTLAGLAAQSRAPDAVVGVAVASGDDTEALLRAALPEVVEAPARGLATAAAAGVAALAGAAGAPPGEGELVGWYWLLHDDGAPAPDCLEQLLLGADRSPAATILVPKTVAWSDGSRLVGIGNRWAPGTPVVEHLEPGERDQGQYDVERAVYAGDSAGMLVRADVWEALGGLDPVIGDWAGAADLCRRAWGSGGEVRFIPQAVVAHRQAGRHGVRVGAARPSPRRAARRGQLLLELTQAPGWALPWRWVRAALATAVRALLLLLTQEPEEAIAALRGGWDALAHPRRLHRARRSARRPPVDDLRRPPQVRASRGTVLANALDSWNAARRPLRGGSGGWLPRRLWWSLGIAAALGAAALVREPGQLLGAGTLRGGGLLPAPRGLELLDAYLTSWQDVRFGVPTGQPAYLPILAAASLPVLGSVDLLLRLAFGLAVPLAFLSAWTCAGTWLTGRRRITLALAWAVLPAGVAAMGGGRISTLAVLLLGPWVARAAHLALVEARAGRPALRRSIAAGLLLGLVAAFAPGTWVLVALVAPMAWIAGRRPRWAIGPGLVVLGSSTAFVLLWLPRVAQAPWRLTSDLGRTDPALAEPAAWVPGLSPGGPSAVAWAGLPLLLVALVAVLVRPTRGRLLVLALALVLLVLAAWLRPLAERLWPDAPTLGLWPGQLLLVAGGLLLGLVAATTRDRPDSALGAAPPGAAVRVLRWGWWGSVAVLLAGWWAAPTVALVGSQSPVPAVVSLAQDSEERPRALVLVRDAGPVRYAVATAPQPRLGDADALAAPHLDPGFADVVADLVSGAAGDLEADLGGRGIRYVVFDGAQDDPLVAELDAAIGLRRLATGPEQSLWLVAGQPVRAELAGQPQEVDVVVPVRTTPTSVDVVLHPQTRLPRTLLLAESADPGWRGTLADQPLALVGDARGMLTAGITGTGRLTVRHGSTWPLLAGAQLLVMAALVVLALPKRGRVDVDRGEVG